uniref:Uncharacterized protein n=1 Tax=Rhizophora mucronata TaxID=61149 RepID=A0A2P2II40_RHIMU
MPLSYPQLIWIYNP